MSNEIVAALKQICEEKKIPMDLVLQALEQALAAAYRKDFGEKDQNIRVEFNPETGKMRIFDVKTVVKTIERKNEKEETVLFVPLEKEKQEEKREGEEKKTERRFNAKTDITLKEAKKIKKKAKLGEEIKQELKAPSGFGRVAAQVAKQVIVQRLNEIEKDVLYQEFKNKEGKVLTGFVQRKELGRVLVDFDRLTAILPRENQIPGERYEPGQRIKVYIVSVEKTSKGPKVILSRTHPEIVRELFTSEIPEIQSGSIEIKSIAREAGSRSKVAVQSKEENIDPVGSCIGQRGARIQTIISELGGEKIDVVQYNEDPLKYISQALAPAKIKEGEINKKEKIAKVIVAPDRLSLAIGRGGQNVRLASQLTGWKIEIRTEEEEKEEKGKEESKNKEEAEKLREKKKSKNDLDKKEKEKPEDKKDIKNIPSTQDQKKL